MVVHPHNTHLTTSIAFSLTLSTISFEYSTLEWFAISTCIAIAVDLLPSPMQLRNSYRISCDTRNLVRYLVFYCVISAILRQNDERKSFICWEFAGSLLGISAFLPEASQLNSP